MNIRLKAEKKEIIKINKMEKKKAMCLFNKPKTVETERKTFAKKQPQEFTRAQRICEML